MNKLERLCERLEDNWNRSSERKRIWKYIGVYTVVFAVTVFIVYSAFILGGKSFIWVGSGGDGRTQYYTSLVYMGRFLRRAILNVLRGDAIPFYDINMAMGSDMIGVLLNQSTFDPLELLAVFFPTHVMEHYFNALVYIRLYLAGLAFSGMCFHFKKEKLLTLIGAMIYVFCGYSITAAAYHYLYMDPVIQLPLMIWGIDLILQNRKPYVFTFAVFYSALCGFYFLYMMTILMGIFTLVRCFDYYPARSAKALIKSVGKGIGSYILGIFLSAIILIPGIALYFECSRSSFSNKGNLLYYSWNTYRTELAKLIAPTGYWERLSLAAIVLIVLFVMFALKGSRFRTLKILLLIGFAIFFAPLGGYIMNGFQYPENRWSFGLSLLLAFCVVDVLPVLLEPHFEKPVVIACMAAVFSYGFFILCQPALRTEQNLFGMVALTVTSLLLFALPALFRGLKFGKQLCTVALLMVVVVNVSMNGVYKFSKNEGNEISEFPARDVRTSVLENALELKAQRYLTGNPGRIDSTSFGQNHNMVWQVPAMNGYWSVMNKNTVKFFDTMEINQRTMNFRIKGTDQRAIFTTLLSTARFIDSPKQASYVPYGYTKIDNTKGFDVYINEYSLPWGYTYDNVISYDYIDGMNGVEKQEAMLQAVALEQSEDQSNINSISYDEYEVPFDIEYDGCEWNDGQLIVSKNNATITLRYVMPAGVEEYVRVDGFITNGSGISAMGVTVADETVNKLYTAYSNIRGHYYGCEDYLVNLGYSENERTSCTITFPNKGIFQLNDIQLIALPMDNYPARVEALREEPMENIQWGTNRLTGTVDLSKDKILCVSVPYSKGWTAKVDGEKREILRGNYMFMCLPLTAGHHDIEFSYCSPGIRLGIVLTACSACIVIWMLARDRKQKKRTIH